MTFRAFPSIEQFRTVIKRVEARARYDGVDEKGEAIFNRNTPLPTLHFKGTVKIHGTNACVHRPPHGEIRYQSRNGEITPLKDNAAFAFEMSHKPISYLFDHFNEGDDVYIYGEWCGGTIQKGVGVTGLDRMFVVFDVVVNDERLEYISHIRLPDHKIYNINDFPVYLIEIDFNDPQAVQNDLIKLTQQVEDHCPVAEYFGADGIGEGIVWTLAETKGKFKATEGEFRFKVKGEKHSVSKVKVLAAVDVEKVESIKELIENTVTENRCLQGISFLEEAKLEIVAENTGEFIRWVFGDIVKEESDTIHASGFVPKELGGPISKAAKNWYFNRIDPTREEQE